MLKLYVLGQTPRSEVAVANLKALMRVLAGDDHEYQVIDITTQPEIAEQERLLAVPTLIKTSPPPSYRVIGDLSDTAAVAAALGLDIRSKPAQGDSK